MAKDNQVIIEVSIDSEAARKRANELTGTIAAQKKELQAWRKVLNDSGGTNKEAAEEVRKLSQRIKENNGELRRAQKEAGAEENSVNALRASINRLNNERNNLNTSTREGAREFARLTQRLKEQREQLNETSKEAGSFKDNIGNYTASIQEAVGLNNEFIGSLGGIVEGFKASTTATNAFKFALSALGIGAIITLVSSFFTQTRQGRQIIERFGAVTKAIFSEIGQIAKAIFNNIGGFFRDFSSDVKEFWDNPLESAKNAAVSLGNAILDNLINRVTGFVDSVKIVGTALKQVFEGEFSKAIDTAKGLGTTFVQTFTGASKEAIDEFGNSIKGIGEGIADTVTRADNLAKANINLRASIRALRVEAADQQREAEKNRKLRDDEFKSLSERLAFNEKVKEAEEERRKTLLALNAAQQRIIQNDIALQSGEATEEQKDQLSELAAEALEIEEDFQGRTTEQLTEANSIRREELQAQANFEAALLEERILREELAGEELLQKRLEILDKEREAALVGLQEGSVERQLVEQEFINKRLELQREAREQSAEEERVFAEQQQAEREARLQREIEAERRALEQRKQIEEAYKEIERSRTATARQAADFVISALGEESAAGKAAFLFKQGLAIADVIVNLNEQLSLIALKAQEIALTTPGIFGAVAGTTYQIQQSTQASVGAALNVANIAAQTVEGFASGGSTKVNIRGEGVRNVPNKRLSGYTGKGDPSQPAGFLGGGNVGHKDEFVISSPVLQNLGGAEVASAITGQPIDGFAKGGVAMAGARISQQSNLAKEVAQSVAGVNVELSLVEFTRKFKDFNDNQAKVNA